MILAFEREANSARLRELIESNGVADCLVCRSAAEVKRLVRKRRIGAVLCGFKLPDDSCQALYNDLPAGCSMLMLAPQTSLDLCETEDIFKLATPVRKSDLLSSVRMLLQLQQKIDKKRRPPRSEEEKLLVEQAKAVLMDRHGMTEEQAHRFLQKESMDNGAKLTDTARLVLTGE